MIGIVSLRKAAAAAQPAFPLFEDMTVTLPTNQICAVLGRRGTGRSTFLRLLSGSEHPDAGAIITQARFSVVANSGSLFHPGLTGLENIALAARVYGLPAAKLTDIVLGMTNFGPAWQIKAGTLMSKMRKSMEMILGAVLPFDCYLLDDVERVEPESLHIVMGLLSARHAGMIFTAHNPKLIRDLAACACVISGRTMHAFDSVEEAIDNYA